MWYSWKVSSNWVLNRRLLWPFVNRIAGSRRGLDSQNRICQNIQVWFAEFCENIPVACPMPINRKCCFVIAQFAIEPELIDINCSINRSPLWNGSQLCIQNQFQGFVFMVSRSYTWELEPVFEWATHTELLNLSTNVIQKKSLCTNKNMAWFCCTSLLFW